jgi:hypothetical protein
VSNLIKQGTFVEITTKVLDCEDRSPAIPEETKNTPLMMWVRGFATAECELGEEAEIETPSGRKVKGIVTAVEPAYTHDFGKYVSEIAYIGKQAKDMLFK